MIRVSVEADEVVYTYKPANNGGPPLWCIGSSCIVRTDDGLFVSGIETIENAVPLNNIRWSLLQRTNAGEWQLRQRDGIGRTREPSPIACFHDGRLLMSVNPTLAAPNEEAGPADPHILQFSSSDPTRSPEVFRPQWEGSPEFTEHSYRGLAADGASGELLMCNNVGNDSQHWSFRDRSGRWTACGRYDYPIGSEYEVPGRIRLCYHNIALANRSAHFFATGDIAEPYPEFRDFKGIFKQSCGTKNDWVFRKLFYYWTPDITTKPPGRAAEIANVDSTAGFMRNLDLWLDPAGRAHMLWLQKSIASEELRDRFFPGTKIRTSLEYAIVVGGELTCRRTLICDDERPGITVPAWARLHPASDGRLFVFYCTYDRSSLRRTNDLEAHSHTFAEGVQSGVRRKNYLMQIPALDSGGCVSVEIPILQPFARFMTANQRAGCAPSPFLDILGMADPQNGEVRYVQIRA